MHVCVSRQVICVDLRAHCESNNKIYLRTFKRTYINTYIPGIIKCVMKTVGCGTSHKYKFTGENTTNIAQK
jgi:hypothetical protein